MLGLTGYCHKIMSAYADILFLKFNSVDPQNGSFP